MLQRLWKDYSKEIIKDDNRTDSAVALRDVRDSQEIPNVAYFPPHRAPIPYEPSRAADMDSPSPIYRKALSLIDYYEFSDTPLIPDSPFDDPKGFGRSKDYADFVTFYEANRALGVLENWRRLELAKIYDEEGEITSDRVSNIFEPLKEAMNYVLPTV